MHILVSVKNKSEGAALKTALADPQTRAFVITIGTLLPFSRRAQKRILDFVQDTVAERVELEE